MTKILHRYLIKEICAIFSLTLFSITSMFMMRYIYYILKFQAKVHVEGYLIYDFFVCLIPELLIMTVPMSLLVAILVALGRLSSDNEITAMCASGVNLVQLTYPVLVIALLFSCGVFGFYNYYFPKIKMYRSGVEQTLLYKVASNIPVQEFLPLSDGFNIYVDKKDENTNRFENVTILKKLTEDDPTFQFDTDAANPTAKDPNPGDTIIILAKTAQINANFEELVLTIQLENGEVHHKSDLDGGTYQYCKFEKLKMQRFIAVDRMDSGSYIKRADEMTGPELSSEINVLRQKMNVSVETEVQNALFNRYDDRLNDPMLDQSTKDRIQEHVHYVQNEMPDRYKKKNLKIKHFGRFVHKVKEHDSVLYRAIRRNFIKQNSMIKEIAQRRTFPFTSFIFSLMAIGLGIKLSPRTRSWGFIISIILFFIYYLMNEFCESFIKTGTNYPFLISWIPNILFTIAGLVLLYQLGKK